MLPQANGSTCAITAVSSTVAVLTKSFGPHFFAALQLSYWTTSALTSLAASLVNRRFDVRFGLVLSHAIRATIGFGGSAAALSLFPLAVRHGRERVLLLCAGLGALQASTGSAYFALLPLCDRRCIRAASIGQVASGPLLLLAMLAVAAASRSPFGDADAPRGMEAFFLASAAMCLAGLVGFVFLSSSPGLAPHKLAAPRSAAEETESAELSAPLLAAEDSADEAPEAVAEAHAAEPAIPSPPPRLVLLRRFWRPALALWCSVFAALLQPQFFPLCPGSWGDHTGLAVVLVYVRAISDAAARPLVPVHGAGTAWERWLLAAAALRLLLLGPFFCFVITGGAGMEATWRRDGAVCALIAGSSAISGAVNTAAYAVAAGAESTEEDGGEEVGGALLGRLMPLVFQSAVLCALGVGALLMMTTRMQQAADARATFLV